MRIFHFISTLGGGGAERQLSFLAPEQVRMGHEVHVAFVNGGPNLSPLKESGVIIHPLQSEADPQARRSAHNYDPRILLKLLAVLRRVRPDIAETWILQMHVLGGLACQLTRTPWVLSEVASAIMYPKSLKVDLMIRMGRRASAIVSNSAAGDQYWLSNGKTEARYIIRNAIPTEAVAQAVPASLEEIGIATDRKVVMFAGRFSEEKNIRNMMQAFFRLPDDPSVIILLCGDGPLKKGAEQEVRDRRLSGRILLLGYRNDLWSLMKRADLMVSLSFNEGSPSAVLEAMASGCPLLLSDIPPHRELLNDRSAVFVDPHDAVAIADGITAVLSNPEQARARSAHARQAIERFSVRSMGQEFDKVYKEVLSRSNRFL